MVRGDQTLRCEVYPYPLVSSLFSRKSTGYSAPRWGGALQREVGWDILSPIDEISCLKATRHYGARRPDTTVRGDQTLRCEVYPYPLVSSLFARKEKTSPIYIFPIWVFLLDGAAQSPRPLLRFTPGYAAVRRRNDLATARAAEGNPSRGVPPGPLPPFAHKGHPPKGCGFASLSSQLLRADALFVSDSIARHWCSLVPRCAPLRRCNLRLVAMDRRPEFSCA